MKLPRRRTELLGNHLWYMADRTLEFICTLLTFSAGAICVQPSRFEENIGLR